MRSRLFDGSLYLFEKLAERGISPEVAAENQQIRQWPHDIHKFRMTATWHTCSDGNLVLLRVTMQENLEGRQHDCKQIRLLLLSEKPETFR
jgi:hypothetical protein